MLVAMTTELEQLLANVSQISHFYSICVIIVLLLFFISSISFSVASSRSDRTNLVPILSKVIKSVFNDNKNLICRAAQSAYTVLQSKTEHQPKLSVLSWVFIWWEKYFLFYRLPVITNGLFTILLCLIEHCYMVNWHYNLVRLRVIVCIATLC